VTREEMLRTSVIVPCYNAAAYVGDAIDSILRQDRQPHEIIVIDDGSVDASAAIVHARFGARLRYHLQSHQGIGAARNRGVRLAEGNCIAFLDADDIWSPSSLGVRLARLEAEASIDGVCGRTEQFVSPDIDPARRAALHCPPGAQPGRVAGAMLVRRSVYDRIGYFDPGLKLGETMDWVARFEEGGLVMAMIGDVVLRRRIHAANTVITERHRQTDYLKILKASIDRRRRQERASGTAE